MIKILLYGLLWSLSFAAHAIYKCESGGTTVYSDEPCPGAKVVEIEEDSKPAARDVAAAERQLKKEKKHLKQLEDERQRRQAKEEKEFQKAELREASQRKKCAALAQRKKWAEEDAAKPGSLTARENAKTNARRAAEKYDLECRR